MGTRIRFAMLVIPALLLSLIDDPAARGQSAEPFKFFREYVGLSQDQIAAVRSGRAVAKTLGSRNADEVFVFGAVYVESTPENYLKLASDVDALRKLPNYLAIQKISESAPAFRPRGFHTGVGRHQAAEKLQTRPLRRATAERSNGHVPAVSRLVCSRCAKSGESAGAENGTGSSPEI